MSFDSATITAPLTLRIDVEEWPLLAPFRISGYTFRSLDIVVVTLELDGRIGQGEAQGVYYRYDTPARIVQTLESLRVTIESGLSRDLVQNLLPAGGARNALDCALWDLQAKLSGSPAWRMVGLDAPHPLMTTFTCGADEPERMAATARGYRNARAIKLKLTGEPADADRVRAVRESLPEVWLGVDANQGFSRTSLEQLMPVLQAARVDLIEQPFPIGQEALLDGFCSPIAIAADESVQSLADVRALVGRFDVMNIKLDKSGGLTEGLAMARAAQQLGIRTMVGNMNGTSLAMAPSFLVGQLCDVVDLDGPVFFATDREVAVSYVDGLIDCPAALWGYSTGTKQNDGVQRARS